MALNFSLLDYFQATYHKLFDVLPFEADSELLEEIVMQSSHITFCEPGEKLFMKGDASLGFYWILDGEAEIVVPDKALIHLRAGDMAGLDSFLTNEPHVFEMYTSSANVATLFINRPCFDRFREKMEFRRLINKQVLYHLSSYKGLLADPRRLLLKH